MIRVYVHDRRGAAAVEFALFLGVFTVAMPSVVDLGIFVYDTIQVQNSAQMGAQALWATCPQLPATDTNACSGGQAAMTAAGHQSSLGTAVTVSLASEAYYCAASNGQLANATGNATKIGNFTTALDASTEVPTAPINCSAVAGALTSKPGDYVAVTATYTYSPVFPAVSVASLLGTTITSTAWMRLQ